MKRLWTGILSALFVAMLAACGSSPTKEQDGAAVEDRGKPPAGDPAAGKPKPDTASTKPLVDKPLSANPLKDPANILSKRSVFFDYDSNLIKDEFKPIVSAHGQYLRANPAAKMKVEGNADERGSREYNLALGQRRADAVKQALQILGARAEQIETVSFGEEKPRCSQAEEKCWYQNRRGDIVYQGE
jgi:peptidoglycan-associated lipoprotein